MSSLINVGTAGEHTSPARPTELGKLIVVFQEGAPSLRRRRDIEQRYTLFALAINQRARPFPISEPGGIQFVRSFPLPLGTSLLAARKNRNLFPFVTC